MKDKYLKVEEESNDERLNEFRSKNDKEEDEKVRLIIQKIDCEVKVGGVVDRSEMKGRGFREVFRDI